MAPLLSIIVPIYNIEPYLRQCADSILAQTLEDIELVLVDDGSPDGCGAICDEYAARDSRVTVLHKPNGGLMSAWKAGVRAARGAYIGFVDGDDWVDPGFFEELYGAAGPAGADMAVGEAVQDEGGLCTPLNVRPAAVFEGRAAVDRFIAGQFAAMASNARMVNWPCSTPRWDKLYRRELLLDNMAYLPDGVANGEDVVTNAAVWPDCTKLVLVHTAAKYHYRVLADSMSHAFVAGRVTGAQLDNNRRMYQALDRIWTEKKLDPQLIDAYMGCTVFYAVYRTANVPGLDRKSRLSDIRAILATAPPGAMDAFARARGSVFIRTYCRMLSQGLLLPCVWITRLWETLVARRQVRR